MAGEESKRVLAPEEDAVAGAVAPMAASDSASAEREGVAERDTKAADSAAAEAAAATAAAAESNEAADEPDGESAPEEETDPEAAAAARELAENNALADVFDDVRRMSADSQLVTPDRWPAIGLVPKHMSDEDFEMFVYEWLEDFQAEHAEEIEEEIAAEKAKAAAVRSATRAVGVPPKIPNRRLAQIEADEEAKAAGASEAGEAAGASEANDAPVSADGETSEQKSAAERADVSAASISQAADEPGTDVAEAAPGATEPVEQPAAAANSADEPAADDNSPFAGLKIPEGYKLEQIEGEWVLVEDEDAAPVRKEISCNRIKVLMGMHSYYLYDQTLMTDNYARWAFLAAEDNPQVTFVECVREDSRVYPRPYAAECLRNPPFSMTDEQIQQTWEAVRDSGNYPDIERTVASNGDVYYYSTDYLSADYAESLAEYDAVERPANV